MIQKQNKAITLIALIITILILLILAGVTIATLTGENGILTKVKTAKEEEQKQTATEILKLKMTECQLDSYGEKGNLPTLAYLAAYLNNDEEIDYVLEESKQLASLDETPYANWEKIYTKLAKYPYEFEIDSSFQVAVNGETIENAIPTGYMKIPTENLKISENGNGIDVTNYATVDVEVPVPKDYVKPSGSTIIEKNGTYDVTNIATAIVQNMYTKTEYDNNYTIGYNDGKEATKGWKKLTGVALVDGYLEYEYETLPSIMLIRCARTERRIYNMDY